MEPASNPATPAEPAPLQAVESSFATPPVDMVYCTEHTGDLAEHSPRPHP
jgi:hypothetical protein